MAKSSGSLRLISAIAVAACTSISQSKSSVALADGQINLPSPAPAATAASDQAAPTKPRNDINPKTETLEREAKALREETFEVTKKHEEIRQAELAAKSAEFKAIQAQAETISQLSRALQQEEKIAARSRDELQVAVSNILREESLRQLLILTEENERLTAENIMIKNEIEQLLILREENQRLATENVVMKNEIKQLSNQNMKWIVWGLCTTLGLCVVTCSKL